MTKDDSLEALERAFWFGDEDFYRRNLTDDCLMVFPGMGPVDREALLADLSGSPRWTGVDIARWLRPDPAEGTAIVAYRASGTRAGMPEPHVADCGSVYVRSECEWRLAFHQQTPVSE